MHDTGHRATSPARLLGAAAAIILVAELFVNLDGSPLAFAGLSAFGIGVTALLLLVVLPRTDPAAHPVLAVSFGITALFTCVAFWSALPFAFGAAAIAAARGPTAPAAILGIIGIVIGFVFCVLA